jgi:hypothetical protein
MKFKSYPSGSSMTTDAAHSSPIIAVDVDWVMRHGGRAQRRRIEKELRRQADKSRRWQDGGKS